MIKRTDEQVICWHEKFRSLEYQDDLNLGVWVQCKDCSHIWPLGEKYDYMGYEPNFFDDLQGWSKEDLEKTRQNPKIIINENFNLN